MDVEFVCFGVVALAAVATFVVVSMMLADTTAATGVSQTGGVDDRGEATTGAAAAEPAQPPKSAKTKSLLKAPVVDDAAARFEAEQQAIEDLQRAQLPEELRLQSGMLPDNYEGYGPWTEAEPTPRIKESKVEAPLKAKLLGHIAKCFAPDTLMGKRVPFEPRDVAEVVDTVTQYLDSEPMLIEDLPFGITVVGDLHGQLYSLHRIFAHEAKDGKPGWERMKYLFLGNYVDRGRQGLEILMALYSLKALYPDRIFLLRGKHEFIKINMKNGLHAELLGRYDAETANEMLAYLNGSFSELSIAAIVQDRYLCVHSGVSAHGFTRSNLRSLTKPCNFYEDDVIITDILWAEPAAGLQGTVFNGNRGSSCYFGLDALDVSLHSVGAEMLVRAHSGLLKGYSFMGNGMCTSLTSATGTLGGDNDGAFMHIDDEGMYNVILMGLSKKRMDWERRLALLDDGYSVEVVRYIMEEEKPAKTADPVGPLKTKKSNKSQKSHKSQKKSLKKQK